MLLAIDCGNTLTKAALFGAQGDLSWSHVATPDQPLEAILEACPQVPVFMVGVASGPQPDWPGVTWLNAESVWPFQVQYSDSLGLDRLAAVAGARAQYPGQDLIVVTLGTCITFNALQEDTFLGGIIAPGLMMRLRAMHRDTANLPDLSSQVQQVLSDWESAPATHTTADSMLRGAIEGIMQQLRSEILAWQGQLSMPQIIFTGGDGMAFANHLKSGIFAASDLELKGLWAQWKYASDSTSH